MEVVSPRRRSRPTFSKAVSYGNALDLTGRLPGLPGGRSETKVIGAYIEGARDGRRFLEALRQQPRASRRWCTRGAARRPAHGPRYRTRRPWQARARSGRRRCARPARPGRHPGSAHRYAGGLRSVRLVRAGAWAWSAAAVAARQSADACEEEGLVVVPLPRRCAKRCGNGHPAMGLGGQPGGPVYPGRRAGIRDANAGDDGRQPSLRLLIANVGEDWLLGRPDAEERLRHVVGRFLEVARRTAKPLAFVLGPAESPEECRRCIVDEARGRLVGAGLAVYPSIERAAWALSRFVGYWEERKASSSAARRSRPVSSARRFQR